MASSITEFRQLMYKPEEVPLPSGLKARIRKIFARDLIGVGELPIPGSASTPEGQTSFSINGEKQGRRTTDRALVKGTVEPKLTDIYDDGGEAVYLPDRLHVTELLEDDYAALAVAILEWCGLTLEDGQAVEAFRADEERAPGESLSGAVSLLAE